MRAPQPAPARGRGFPWSRLLISVIGLTLGKFVFADLFRGCATSPSRDVATSTYVAPTPTPTPQEQPAPSYPTYVVRPGDGWYAIAIANGVDPADLLAANNATAQTVIHPGDVIYLRGPASPAPPPPLVGVAALGQFPAGKLTAAYTSGRLLFRRGERVPVRMNGKVGTVPAEHLQEAVDNGASIVPLSALDAR